MASYDFGYTWVWTHGHLVPLAAFAALSALAVWRKWPRWVTGVCVVVALWAAAGFAITQYVLGAREIVDVFARLDADGAETAAQLDGLVLGLVGPVLAVEVSGQGGRSGKQETGGHRHNTNAHRPHNYTHRAIPTAREWLPHLWLRIAKPSAS